MTEESSRLLYCKCSCCLFGLDLWKGTFLLPSSFSDESRLNKQGEGVKNGLMVRCSVSQMRQLWPFRAVIPSEKPLAVKLTPPQLTVLMTMLHHLPVLHTVHTIPANLTHAHFLSFYTPLPCPQSHYLGKICFTNHHFTNHPLFSNTFQADWYCCIPSFLSGTAHIAGHTIAKNKLSVR